jgi:phage/plasmid-like protein (TIGR03299 family)
MSHQIMENDNMFSVVTTPWHGLGRILPNAPGIDEALQISGLNWTVRRLPLWANQPAVPGQVVRGKLPIESHVALQREDTGELFTLVSSKYEVLQNAEAFEVFRPLVEDGTISLETAGSLFNGKKVWILAKVNSTSEQEVKDGDKIKPYVLLSNSHDASQAVRMGFTPVRVVCNNTLSMAETGEKSQLVRLYHRGGLKANLDLLRDTMNVAVGRFEATMEQYRLLAKKRINKKDITAYIREVLQTEDETPREKAIMEVLLNGRGLGVREADKLAWWDAYNAINEWMLYNRGQSADNRLASAWFGDGYLLDQRAFDIAWKRAA